ncbi:RNA ligase family protein [Hyphomicrobium sp. DY-1]|uniref:ATP-dependent DNA ligase n=1 Tax=Hyphomicrobium sp. DY-1 TaxID=3075650 RepID=UPI0039C1BB8A
MTAANHDGGGRSEGRRAPAGFEVGAGARHIRRMLKKHPFIPPMLATAARAIPAGPEWTCELKLDGYRVQAHVEGDAVTLFSRNGNDLSRRFRTILSALSSFPARSAILDCELVACGEKGRPDFDRLVREGGRCPDLSLWAFDLLMLDGRPMLKEALGFRRDRLNRLLNAADEERLQFSPEFADAAKLLAEAEKRGLEGVVLKKREGIYASGRSREWLKIKTKAWKEKNARQRAVLFNRGRGAGN